MIEDMRRCNNCGQEYAVETDDLHFYERIGVPAPMFCPECRMIRRMLWRNERSLYRRECGLTNKGVISCFAPDSGITVYDRDVWWSDAWDPLQYGAKYDFTKPFFIQFRDLLGRVPMPSLFNARCVGSAYCNHVGEVKNGYLVFASWEGENLSYSAQVLNSKDSMELLAAGHCELSYEVVNSTKIYKSAFVEDSESCADSFFLYGCRGCTSCFGCTNLRNKSYYIFNEPYTREQYLEKVKTFDLGSYKELGSAKKQFQALKARSLRKYANILNSQNSTGDNISNVKNCKECFDFRDDVRDCKFMINGGVKLTDSYDGYGVGAQSELLYESVDTGANGTRFLFDIFVWGGRDVSYCYACHGSENCFGCIGLRQKQYCILNKQYAKDEYEGLISEIKAQMNEVPYISQRANSPEAEQARYGTGKEQMAYRYGEFFPPELSPFAYNETIAQEYFPLTKGEATVKRYAWRDPDSRTYAITVFPDHLPDCIKDVPDSITSEVVGCLHDGTCSEQCTAAFKIVGSELQFYRRMNLPLPRLCPNCRHFERRKRRNPLKLWHGKCMCNGKQSAKGEAQSVYNNSTTHFHNNQLCPNEFETNYAPDRPEIVYCEQCYNSEIA